MKIYAEILAGGKGERMLNASLPKQFFVIGNKPVIIYTIEQFLACEKIDFIIIVVKSDWVSYLNELLEKFIVDKSKIVVVEGGDTRTDSAINGIKYIDQNFGVFDEDIIITHDAVRPFLSEKIILDNIECAMKFGAVDTVVSASDTIVYSVDNDCITNIPERKSMYQGQTPQSFNIKLLLECFENLSEQKKQILTDIAKILVLNDKKVKLVEGSMENIKLTTEFDLIVAEAILKNKN